MRVGARASESDAAWALTVPSIGRNLSSLMLLADRSRAARGGERERLHLGVGLWHRRGSSHTRQIVFNPVRRATVRETEGVTLTGLIEADGINVGLGDCGEII